ncbi:hypothetical protein GOZ89_19730 [Agrobacterium vitis]|uniref:asparagine synthase-related protein n=1 Tax=Agrobacterium vitis TaxID=373 RepID=UPI0012E78B9F|nr:asparagine synthase-related protein [Agrobacterium vitis]MVA81647.1 hypothetical protein [Agrobacterium vitis]
MNFVPQSIKISANRVSNFEDLLALPDRSAPVVTMFSGGLDSTYLLYKLQRLGFKNVQAISVNVGETTDGPLLEQVAMQLGARFVYLEGREAFVECGVTE